MAERIQLRGGTSANATVANPVLASREVGIETDTGRMKVGNGVDAWNDLPYVDAAIADHPGDPTNAHAASAIGFTPVGTIAATNTQAAVAEVATDAAAALASHESDTTGIHGIADTSALETTTGSASKVSAHAALTSAVHGISAYGATLVDDADAATARTTLGLGTIATQAAASVAITGGSVAGITDLAVADGGTGASTAAAARTNLGLTLDRTAICAGALASMQGAPALTFSGSGGWTSVWLLDSASDEAVGGAIALPSWWQTYDVDVHWMNNAAGTGDIRVAFAYQESAAASTVNSIASNSSILSTAGAQNVLVVAPVRTGLTYSGGLITFNVIRDANAADDTLGNDAALIAVVFKQAS